MKKVNLMDALQRSLEDAENLADEAADKAERRAKFRMEYTFLSEKGVEEVVTDTATTLDTARLWCANVGPRNWGRYMIVETDAGKFFGGKPVERGERNPLGVLIPEVRCPQCGAVKLPSGEHLCP